MPDLPLFLMEAAAYYEATLQELWNSVPLEEPFALKFGGKTLTVYSRGEWNRGPGPDFLNAKIAIDGTVLRGDVEIHCRASDWARHGHQNDPAYDRVILHAVGEDDTAGTAAPDTPMIPVFVLPEDFHEKRFQAKTPQDDRGLCAAFFGRLSDEAVLQFVSDAGLERMRVKSDELLTDMIANGAENAFLMRFFELTGIPGNREPFKELARRVLAYPEPIRQAHFLALLWGESGCLPDPVKTALPPDAAVIVCKLWNDWWTIRRKHADPLVFTHRTRPLNSIERRIALLSAFITSFGENPLPAMLRTLENNTIDGTVGVFLEKLALTEDFWMEHSSFTSKKLEHPAVLIGRDRILELLADLLIPSMRAYANVTKDLKQIARIESLYLALPKTGSNRILKAAVAKCFPGREAVFRTAAAQQGLLHLYKNWCEKLSFDCKACPVGHLV